jgi:Flp pilus assembly pilin Flp
MMNKLNEMALKTYIKTRNSQKGATMIEYVLIASLISVIAIAAMTECWPRDQKHVFSDIMLASCS